jgi:molybdopterin synthase catalytic subunit
MGFAAVYIALTDEPLDPAALVAHVRTDACGAVVSFLGVTRETSAGDDRPVDGLTYEAYPTTALPEMQKIAEEADARFGPLGIAIVHRTGEVALGEASVAIAVAAPHRGAAFDACEYAIDEVKKRVDVWKREHYIDGASSWRANA